MEKPATTEEQATAFADSGNIIRMGIAPIRIELMNSISDLTFEEAWQNRISGFYGETARFLSLSSPKDLADVDELGGNRDSS